MASRSRTKKRAAKPSTKKRAVAAKKPAKKAASRKKATPQKSAPKPKNKPPRQSALSLAPPVKPIVAMLRKIILEAAPHAREVLTGNASEFEANGVFARIQANDRKVLLEFVEGDALDAAPGLLEGEGKIRNLAISDLDEVTESVLRGLVRQAVLQNLRAPTDD